MNPWKDLLGKIFPDADMGLAPEEIMRSLPRETPEDPVQRIHCMRKIRGDSGFARLYGAKDVEQFARQAAYMRDFTDDYPKEIPFGDAMPTYADMSLAQLRCYFTWRTKAMQGIWREISFSYVLLYIFELLNTHEAPEDIIAKLAACWLEMREYFPKLDMKMPQWLKDYYICHDFKLPFGELTRGLGLSEFFPQPSRRDSLLTLSSYQAAGSRFFREKPEYLPMLKRALKLAVENLAPLFALHGVNQEETFFMKPARFSFYEPYRDAAAQPPAIAGLREVRISHSEIYRLRGGSWSCAMEDAFRPPSHAVGYAVKRLEWELRRLAGFQAPWNDSNAGNLLEHWQMDDLSAMELTQDPRLPAILSEAAIAAFAPGTPTPVSDALRRKLEQEPLHSILALREIEGFTAQGRHLAALEDNYAQLAACDSINPCYSELTHDQLRTYLTWRTKYRAGIIERTETAYALLYARELENSIGTETPMADLCSFLRNYANLDRTSARRLPERIEALARKNGTEDLPGLLAREGVQAWFPGLFLFGDCAQLPVFDQLSLNRLTKSKFYRKDKADLFNACFDKVLAAAAEAFRGAGFSLRREMQGPYAPALAGFLLKRMEQKMRERAGFPYALRADALRIISPALHGRSRLRTFLASGVLARAIDEAVNEFAKENDMSVLRGGGRYAPPKKASAASRQALPPEAEVLPPVEIDFSLLPGIREAARELTEALIVEDDESNWSEEPDAETAEPAEYSSLYEALTSEQRAFIECMCAGGGTAPMPDELMVEHINEIALDVFGDTLIEMGEDGFEIIEEYRERWKEL